MCVVDGRISQKNKSPHRFTGINDAAAYRVHAALPAAACRALAVTAIPPSADRAGAPVRLSAQATAKGLDRLQGRVARNLGPQSHSVQELYAQYLHLMIL